MRRTRFSLLVALALVTGCMYPDYGFKRRVCSSVEKPVVFCADFDGEQADAGWNDRDKDGLSYPADSTISPPRAAAFARNAIDTARLGHATSVVLSTRTSLSFSLFVEDIDPGVTAGFAMLHVGDWGVRLSLRDDKAFFEELYRDAGTLKYDARPLEVARGRYQRITIEVDRAAQMVVVRVDGIAVTKPMVSPPSATAPAIEVGILYQAGMGPRATRLRIDDVVLRVE